MLGVTLLAAALLLPALLGHHIVAAAVVAEDAATKPRSDSRIEMRGLAFFKKKKSTPVLLSGILGQVKAHLQ